MKKKILVRVDGSKDIGLGHVYNMITILKHYRNPIFLIVMNKNKKLGHTKFEKFNFDVKFYSDKIELKKIISKFEPNIIFNDILNTKSEYMKWLKQFNSMIVNFEDLGIGKKYADLVFNPIYYSKKNIKNHYYGEKYACVREEFRNPDRNKIRKNVKKVVITFGGTDPTNKTNQILKIINNSSLSKIEFNVIIGLGYTKKDYLKKIINNMRIDGFKINIIEKTDNISDYVRDCDFAITSNGRTVFEIAAMRIPMISIAVNERERTHSFVRYSKSGFYLNVQKTLDEKSLLNCINQMLEIETRKKFVKNMKKTGILNGIELVIKIIEQKYKNYI
jgi:spore coat polysaccharide biosynthesis predicted glycosyltransferase SpsG